MTSEREGLRFLPVGLDLRGRRCLVVGGGVIGTRKALTLASCGAEVTVVSPVVTAALAEAAARGGIRHRAEHFRAEHLDGAFLVVAATDDDALNEAVAEAAGRARALVCDASSAGRSQVTFGAMLRREDATVAVFTDGRDPSHARRTRDSIAGFLDRTTPSQGDPSAGGEAYAPALEADISGPACASLVMIGASLPGGLGSGPGPALPASDLDAFARARKGHVALHAFLDHVRTATSVRDALVWNTCQRVELYAWIPEDGGAWARLRLEEELRRGLFGDEERGLRVSVLHGPGARRHLLRTVCGLHSDLPGDKDVAAQLETALRAASCAGLGGSRIRALVADAVRVATEVREYTAWGAFSTGYCAAALARVVEVDELDAAALRYVVIGGSTTSRSVLTALRAEHLVPERALTTVYRDHHGQMKELRAAVGNGRRLRVHDYGDEPVSRAMAAADVVIFGLDQAEPVWDAAALLGLRDVGARPMTVVDFNSSGSLGGLGRVPKPRGLRVWAAKELDRAVAAHVAIVTTQEGFAAAVAEVESWIERHLEASGTPDANGFQKGRRHGPAERTV